MYGDLLATDVIFSVVCFCLWVGLRRGANPDEGADTMVLRRAGGYSYAAGGEISKILQ